MKQPKLKITMCVNDDAGNDYYHKGFALDYIPELKKFLVEEHGKISLSNRLWLIFEKLEKKE
jgi:hypothetical protein